MIVVVRIVLVKVSVQDRLGDRGLPVRRVPITRVVFEVMSGEVVSGESDSDRGHYSPSHETGDCEPPATPLLHGAIVV